MLVLDTHVWLWWLHRPEEIPLATRRQITQAEQRGEIRVSAISVWEVATKTALGKLDVGLPLREWLALARQYPGIRIEPLDADDALSSAFLPGEFHKDPADRIIVALARRMQAQLVTADRLIRAYPHVTTLWKK